MRCGFHYDYHGMEMVYHKTLPYSCIVEEDPRNRITYNILYDILIKQTGEIHADWSDAVLDDVRLDVPAYRHVVFEPYDMHWIEKID